MATKHKKTASKTAAKTAQSKSANRSAPTAAKKTAQKLSPTAKAAKPNKPAKGQKPGKTTESKKKQVTAKAPPARAAVKAPPAKAAAKAPPARAAVKAPPAKPAVKAPPAKPAVKAPPAKAAVKAPPARAAAPVAKAPPPPGRPMGGKPGTPGGGPVRGTPGQIVPTLSRTPARSPVGAEELKLKIGALYSATSQIKALKRSMSKGFWEIGRILGEIQEKKLFEVKGYGSFEAFIEREIDLGKLLSLRLVRITQIFVREAALAAGYERATAGLAAFDGETDMLSTSPSVSAQGTSSGSAAGRQMLPPHKL